MNATVSTPAFPILRYALILGGIAGTIALTGWWGANLLGRPALAHDLAMAAGLVGAVGVLGLIPAWILSRRMKGGVAWGFLAGMALRLPLCAVAIWLFPRLSLTRSAAFSDTVAALYLLLLLVEVGLVSQFIKKNAPALQKEPV